MVGVSTPTGLLATDLFLASQRPLTIDWKTWPYDPLLKYLSVIDGTVSVGEVVAALIEWVAGGAGVEEEEEEDEDEDEDEDEEEDEDEDEKEDEDEEWTRAAADVEDTTINPEGSLDEGADEEEEEDITIEPEGPPDEEEEEEEEDEEDEEEEQEEEKEEEEDTTIEPKGALDEEESEEGNANEDIDPVVEHKTAVVVDIDDMDDVGKRKGRFNFGEVDSKSIDIEWRFDDCWIDELDGHNVNGLADNWTERSKLNDFCSWVRFGGWSTWDLSNGPWTNTPGTRSWTLTPMPVCSLG